MRPRSVVLALLGTFAVLWVLHYPLLRLPYFWDEAGYYIPAALDFYHSWALIPRTTLPTGHTPLVMVYLAAAWHLCGYSALVTRSAMALLAAATVVTVYALGRRVGGREVAIWTAWLLALSPIFFAQSTLAHLDLTVALFTSLAVLFLLDRRFGMFTLAASLAILSKETAVVLLPVAWLYTWRKQREQDGRGWRKAWVWLLIPLLLLAGWAFYYHHATGYWTGNREYLAYNLYTTLAPARIFWSLLRRLYEMLVAGFNGLLAAGAAAGLWWGRSPLSRHAGRNGGVRWQRLSDFFFLMGGLTVTYLVLLSVAGGAILPRYLLPAVPLCYLAAVVLIFGLPKTLARAICGVALACFTLAWFINPPYPFPYEDNLAYADFVPLHQQAAQFLEHQPGRPRILTAWPATDELTHPDLGYVGEPLRVVPIAGFASQDFAAVTPNEFDLLYFYSRKWEPPGNWISKFPLWLKIQGRYFDYAPQVADQVLVGRYQLRLLRSFGERGQWVRIYTK